MIALRLGLLFFCGVVIAGASSMVAGWIPCPRIQPPATIGGQLYTHWSLVIFAACAVFLMLPWANFQFWASALPTALMFFFGVGFYLSGDWRFAEFLLIHGILTIFVTLVFKAIVLVLSETLEWNPLFLGVIALPMAYLLADGWAYVQAIGFSQSLC